MCEGSGVFGVPCFGVPKFGVPDFGAPGFGAPEFAVPSFGIPHEFVKLQEADTTKTMVSEFLSSGLLSRFRSCTSLIFGVSGLRFSELQVSELHISELQISEVQISELQMFGAPVFEISEFLVSDFLRSGAPTSQLTSLIVQEAVELANTTETIVSEFPSSGVLALPGFRVVHSGFLEFLTSDFRSFKT